MQLFEGDLNEPRLTFGVTSASTQPQVNGTTTGRSETLGKEDE